MSTGCLCVFVFCIAGHMNSFSCLKCQASMAACDTCSTLQHAGLLTVLSTIYSHMLRTDDAEFVGNLSGILHVIKARQKDT